MNLNHSTHGCIAKRQSRKEHRRGRNRSYEDASWSTQRRASQQAVYRIPHKCLHAVAFDQPELLLDMDDHDAEKAEKRQMDRGRCVHATVEIHWNQRGNWKKKIETRPREVMKEE